MKKTLIILMMVLLSVMLIISCDDDSKPVYTVTFNSNGGSDVDAVKVNEGETVTKPADDPTYDGHIFNFWSLDGTKGFDFDTVITEDITLKAVWIETPSVANVGDTITLGTGTWKALAVNAESKTALLISSDAMGYDSFNTNFSSYEESYIRRFLNGSYFLTNNGLSTKYMLKVDVTSSIETTTISDSGQDYVFLLSKTEAENTNYFADNNARKTISPDINWWLRSVDSNNSKIYYVQSDGSIVTANSSCNYCMRPAFWYKWN